MSHSIFTEPQNKKTICSIYPSTQFSINCVLQAGGLKTTEKFAINVDKFSTQNLLQIRLCNVNDQSKMLIATVDVHLFEQFKIEQSLNVSFDGFVDHLTRILDSCKKGELFITLLCESSATHQVLQFYEKRSFRNLIHLYLPVQEAPINIILAHINQTMQVLQQQSTSYCNQLNNLEKDLSYKDEQINDLRKQLQNMNSQLVEQENLIFARNTEQISRLQQEIKHLTEAKNIEIKKLNQLNVGYQEKIDYLTKENSLANQKYVQEMNKSDAFRAEISSLKAGGKMLKEQNDKLHADIQSNKNHDRKNDHLLSEVRKQMHDLEEKIKVYDKQKNELVAELEAEKNICQIKRNALQIASDELSKSAAIRAQQTKELIQLKQKVNIRTDVALQQERFIQTMEKENASIKKRLDELTVANLEKYQTGQDFQKEIQNLQSIADSIDLKYSRKITDLQNRLSQTAAETELNKNTNRYLQISNQQKKYP